MAGNLLQFQSHWILASLRRQISSQEKKHGDYSIPRGGAFELVSCPHYLGEIIVYGGLMIMLGQQNLSIFIIFTWVVSPICDKRMSHTVRLSAESCACSVLHLVVPIMLQNCHICSATFTQHTLEHLRWRICYWRLDQHTDGTRSILSSTQRTEEPSSRFCTDQIVREAIAISKIIFNESCNFLSAILTHSTQLAIAMNLTKTA